MPELPEVETIAQGIKTIIVNQQISNVIIRQPQLRWKITASLTKKIKGLRVNDIIRRGKYLIWQLDQGGNLIWHLGMSGVLRVVTPETTLQKHDHVDIIFNNHTCLRYNDPRRFGALIYTEGNANNHRLLKHLGVEPLAPSFTGDYLYLLARARKISIKTFLMQPQIVVGVGNIYATEALFSAGIHPARKVNSLSLSHFEILVVNIKTILQKAIIKGGTTFRDFKNIEGKPGYFKQDLKVYGRAGLKCVDCDSKLVSIRISQRASVFCPSCQKI